MISNLLKMSHKIHLKIVIREKVKLTNQLIGLILKKSLDW